MSIVNRKSIVWIVTLALVMLPCAKIASALAAGVDEAVHAGSALVDAVAGGEAAGEAAHDTPPCMKSCKLVPAVVHNAETVPAPRYDIEPDFHYGVIRAVWPATTDRSLARSPRGPPETQFWLTYRAVYAITARLLN